MGRTRKTLREMLEVSPEDKIGAGLSVGISNRIEALMAEKGLNKKTLSEALGKRPSEISRWLSGHHNFTISTLTMLGSFFGKPIITVAVE